MFTALTLGVVAGCSAEAVVVPAEESLISGTLVQASAAQATWNGTVWTRRTATPVGPAPGGGTPSWAPTPADYGFCGLERISGFFDPQASAQILVNPAGYFELVVTQGNAARLAGRPFPEAAARCRRLSEFTNLPAPANARGFFAAANDADDALQSSTSSPLGDPGACIWQGFSGMGVTFPWNGSLTDIADFGAYGRSSNACLQNLSPGGAPCSPGGLKSTVVARTEVGGGSLTSRAYCSRYTTNRLWTYHPQANQQLRQNNAFTGATTSGNFCWIAGLVGGGADQQFGGSFSVYLEEAIPPAPFSPAPQYRFRSLTSPGQGSVAAWIDCLPLAQ